MFVTDVVTKVKELLAVRERRKDSISYISPDLVVENPPMHRQETEAAITRAESFDDDLFYSLTSFFQALNLDISDLEGFTELPSGLVSLSLNGHDNLVFLNMSSTENLVRFQRSDSFEFLREVSLFLLNMNFLILISSNFLWLLMTFFKCYHSAEFCFKSFRYQQI